MFSGFVPFVARLDRRSSARLCTADGPSSSADSSSKPRHLGTSVGGSGGMTRSGDAVASGGGATLWSVTVVCGTVGLRVLGVGTR